MTFVHRPAPEPPEHFKPAALALRALRHLAPLGDYLYLFPPTNKNR